MGIANDGGIALLLPDGVTIVDQVGMSSGSAYQEGAPLSPLPADADQGYERQPGGSSGSCYDTDDNASDFTLISPSDPQNLSSPLTVCAGAATATPTPTGTATPLSTSTPTPAPTASARIQSRRHR